VRLSVVRGYLLLRLLLLFVEMFDDSLFNYDVLVNSQYYATSGGFEKTTFSQNAL
jgi:hypothetical protein